MIYVHLSNGALFLDFAGLLLQSWFFITQLSWDFWVCLLIMSSLWASQLWLPISWLKCHWTIYLLGVITSLSSQMRLENTLHSR